MHPATKHWAFPWVVAAGCIAILEIGRVAGFFGDDILDKFSLFMVYFTAFGVVLGLVGKALQWLARH